MDGQISLKEVKYINKALQEGVSKTETLAMLKRVISTDELKFAENDLVYGPSAGELCYIHEHWSSFSKNVKFYYHKMEVLPLWEE